MILKTAFEKLFKIREEAGRARNNGKSGADQGFDPHEKPFLDHLEDLRKTLMQMVITLGILTIFTFAFNQQIFKFVQMPLKMAEIDDVGTQLWDVSRLMTLSPQEMLMLAIKTSFIAGLIMAFPLLVYQLFQFILPGLRQVEKKMVIPGALVGFLLFLGGASFAFFLASPIALKFFYQFEQERVSSIDPTAEALRQPVAEFALIGLDGKPIPIVSDEKVIPTEGDPVAESLPESVKSTLDDATRQEIREYILGIFAFREGSEIALRYDESRDKVVIMKVKGKTTEYRMGDYINFVTRLVLVFGISFQLPVVVTILVKLELLTARVMKATRAYAWVIMMVAAAIFTPPDIITLGLLAGPLIVLYEICIIIATVMERGREKKERAKEEARKSRLEKLYERRAEDLSEEEKEELHKHEIAQYEKEHENISSDEHDGENYDDPYHNDPYHDEYGHPIDDPHADDHKTDDANDNKTDDAEHDEGWHDGHPDDPHYGEEVHEPVQDWPDREDESDDEKKSDETPVLESDHAEPTEDDSSRDEFDDDEVCDPAGPIVDLNHSDFDEIMDLPNMNEELAQMIIDHRPYDSFDDVEDIPGMDSDKLGEMIERLMLG